jgi:hypothetical protein
LVRVGVPRGALGGGAGHVLQVKANNKKSELRTDVLRTDSGAPKGSSMLLFSLK